MQQTAQVNPSQPEFIKSQPAARQGSGVSKSLRLVTFFELSSVLGSILLALWAVAPLYSQQRWPLAVPGLLALGLMTYSHWVRGETLAELGFSGQHLRECLRLLALPFLLGSAGLLVLGFFADSLHFSRHFGWNLLTMPVWGCLQQYALQAYFYRRLRSLFQAGPTSREGQGARLWRAQFLAAGLFALVHLPNLPLVLLTFGLGVVFVWIYERAPNLWLLGLAHGVLSWLAMQSLPGWLLESMSVGYKFFQYQKF